MSEESTGKGRALTGKITSDKMDKTIVVVVERLVKDKLYGKYVRKHKKYYAHDDENSGREGDTVKIVENRPISKTKTWMLAEILERAK
jgi:small subunit ribosomal protein S17